VAETLSYYCKNHQKSSSLGCKYDNHTFEIQEARFSTHSGTEFTTQWNVITKSCPRFVR
jgi:hypothetical protein